LDRLPPAGNRLCRARFEAAAASRRNRRGNLPASQSEII